MTVVIRILLRPGARMREAVLLSLFPSPFDDIGEHRNEIGARGVYHGE